MTYDEYKQALADGRILYRDSADTFNNDKYVQILNPKSKRYTLINKTKGIVVGTKRDDKPFSNVEIIDIDIKVTKPPESPFGDAVQKAIMVEKSVADKSYDKFKKDERDHTAKLKNALIRLNDIGAPATAHDLKTSMVIMWELLQKEYIEDVTPAARTGGAVSPDTTYSYKITSKGRVFAAGYGI